MVAIPSTTSSGTELSVGAPGRESIIPLIEHLDEADRQVVMRAWEFAFALYGHQRLLTGELATEHALGILRVLDAVRADQTARAAGVLFHAGDLLARPEEQLTETFGSELAEIVLGVRQLARMESSTRQSQKAGDERQAARQTETVRKMLLAFATDVRVVLVRLASRLQTLRWLAATRSPVPDGLAHESLTLYAPLANRLGVWQMKWELEDLAFRFTDPVTYKRIAVMLDEKRAEREAFISATVSEIQSLMEKANLGAEVTGRPKHIFSIVNKMNNKRLPFESLFDIRAVRIIVADEAACYSALGLVQQRWSPVTSEFDDYIARPKPNGYRSLHTIVQDDQGRPFEIQIRTKAMHRFAEFGVAAHWRYKEGGAKDARYEERIAWLRQLLAWRADVSGGGSAMSDQDRAEGAVTAPLSEELIYVLTPQARVIELNAGSTPVDFAYQVHTDLGHRCRGARVDGALLPLNTPLKTGQTVEIISARQGNLGPSRDWLNPQLGFLHSARARAKVRQWFNAQELAETVVHGRERLEKVLQREGKTAVNHDELAQRLGFLKGDDLYVSLAKETISVRTIETALGRAEPIDEDATPVARPSRSGLQSQSGGGVLVVGMESLMTELARCCKPAPPDPIGGFVTKGRGVSIHRADCPNFRTMSQQHPERVIETDWGNQGSSVYPVDIHVMAADRQGLLRDISEVFSREKINVVAVQTESKRGMARMRFTAEVSNAEQVKRALALIGDVPGIETARRG